MLDSLLRSLEDGVRPVYLVVGTEALLGDRAVQAIVEAVMPSVGPPSFNVTSVRCSDGDTVRAMSMARTLPMMGDRRLIVIRDIQEGSDGFFSALLEWLTSPGDTTTVVLAGSGFPKVVKGGRAWTTKVRNAVKKHGVLVDLKQIRVSPPRFLADTAASLGHSITPDAANMLVALVGEDLGTLSHELEKATLYVAAGEAVDVDAVREACSMLADAVVWDLAAAIAGRDAGRALALLHRLLEDGEAPHKLLGMIVWQLRTVLEMNEQVRKGVPDHDIQRNLRVKRDLWNQVRPLLGPKFPGAAIVLGEVAQANRAMNSARVGGRRVLEELVVRLASA